MKIKMFLSTIVLLSIQPTMASMVEKKIKFHCELRNEMSEEHIPFSFSGDGEMKFDEANRVQVTINSGFNVYHGREERVINRDLKLAGGVTIYPAGELMQNEVTVALVQSEDRSEMARISLGLPSTGSSVVYVDGFNYFSNCQEIR